MRTGIASFFFAKCNLWNTLVKILSCSIKMYRRSHMTSSYKNIFSQLPANDSFFLMRCLKYVYFECDNKYPLSNIFSLKWSDETSGTIIWLLPKEVWGESNLERQSTRASQLVSRTRLLSEWTTIHLVNFSALTITYVVSLFCIMHVTL